ncbi:MAG TPA: peptidoglycan DD-metalloendopeptidase family protein [Candidatus Paceibacterota bacterium]|nr:peptidoglycan DD-metalloendopeptidase family protein [Candidatus Paceibacterota bacterium]
MDQRFKKIAIAFLLAAAFGVACVSYGPQVVAQVSNATTTAGSDAASTDIASQIAAKQQQLNAINAQIQSTQASLNSTQAQKQTLQGQLAKLNGNISTLTLNIKADQIMSDQLQLEIQGLQGDMSDIQSSIAVKETAVESILKQLQKDDTTNGNLLLVFLKGKSLADGVFEAQSLVTLQGQLSEDIGTLTDLHGQYNDNIQASQSKQAQIAIEQQNMQNQQAILQDQQAQKQALLASTKGQESTYQKQIASLQAQQQQIANDIEALDAIQRAKVNTSAIPQPQAGILLIPIQGATTANISQGYGATSFAKNGYKGKWHNGLDLATPIGTPILAADDGVISGVANEDLYCPKGAYGKFITINHFNGLTTLYGHLSRQLVKIGDTVKRGQIIGYSGETGYATGPHLHFTVFAQSTFSVENSKYCGPLPVGGDLDPYGYLF